MPSDEWKYFMDNYYGNPYMMWHDGINEKSVTRLVGEERDQAEDMLIQSLKEGDHYAAIGLRELRSEKAIPHLEEVLQRSSGVLAVEIAVALCIIRGNHEFVPQVIAVLKRSPFWSARIRAALSLRRFPTTEVIESLYESVARDPDYLVRNHASETLLFLHSLEPAISEHKEIFNHMIFEYDRDGGKPTEEAYDHYSECARLLRELIEAQGSVRQETIIDDIWSWNR